MHGQHRLARLARRLLLFDGRALLGLNRENHRHLLGLNAREELALHLGLDLEAQVALVGRLLVEQRRAERRLDVRLGLPLRRRRHLAVEEGELCLALGTERRIERRRAHDGIVALLRLRQHPGLEHHVARRQQECGLLVLAALGRQRNRLVKEHRRSREVGALVGFVAVARSLSRGIHLFGGGALLWRPTRKPVRLSSHLIRS